MALVPSDASDQAWSRRERPWLIPSNRKLRHLHAITLRNLTLNEPARPRRKTIDDDALPTTLKSPAKILAMRETKQLGHSRSQDNLRPIHEHVVESESERSQTTTPTQSPEKVKPKTQASTPPSEKEKAKPKTHTPPRPTFAKLRRRSTLEWASATSLQRQKKLEDMSSSRMPDVFFSVHVAAIEEPIYISEVIEKAMNPNFNHMQLDEAAPAIQRLDSLTVKFWTKTNRQHNFSLLVDLTLNLRSLQFIGKTLASFHHPFPPNCVLFLLTDGFYTAFTDARVDEPVNPFAAFPVKERPRIILPTSSFDALLRLSKLDDSIQDALALRDRLTADLEHVVEDHQLASPVKNHVSQAEDFVKTIDYAKGTVQKQIKTVQQRLDEKRKNLQSRRDTLIREREDQAIITTKIQAEQEEMTNMHEEKNILSKSVAAQRRRISTDLQNIYPVAPVPARGPLAFDIRGLHLPNSEALDARHAPSPEHIAAALGHVSHVLQLLSYYWNIVLPYHPHPRSSTSTISDPISTLTSTNPAGAATTHSPFANVSPGVNEKVLRTFPLFAKGAVRFRFDYGLFLLNKDIQLLLEMAWGVRVLDIRQTLPNLLYALFCATAGEGELVARKAGGVRGLTRVGRDDRGLLERRDSEDSTLLGSEDGHARPLGTVGTGDMAAFESLKKVGRKRDRRIDGLR